MTAPTSRPAGAGVSHRTLVETVRAVLAIALLAAVVAGLPVALWALGHALQPAAGLDISRIGAALTRPDDGSLFLLALLVIGWAGWAVFTLTVTVEVVALVRGIPTPRLPLLTLAQQGAAVLVATAALLVTPTGSPLSHPPVARPVTTAAAIGRTDPQPAPSTPPPAPTGEGPSVTVRRHDTLWSLAQTHLGSGERFSEIVALNLGRPQPDGRALTGAHWIYPGWVLRLPPDARKATRSAETYTVEPGDSLWSIADEHLGTGQRYGQIYQLNAGHRQPDGLQLTDPDEIRPGWHLRLPTTAAPPAAATGMAAPSPNVANPRPPDPTSGPAELSPTPTPPEVTVSPGVSEHAPVVAPSLVLGLGTIVLTGLVAELTRRRRLQQRARRTGQRIAMPRAEPAGVEQKARTAVDPVTIDTLRLALRALGSSCRNASQPLPDVTLVRVTSNAVELVLQDDDPAAVDPFRSVDPRTWRLDAMPTSLPDEDAVDPFPGLVTLGVENDALLLLNLEVIGTLALAGPDAATGPVLRALATELAVSPLAEACTLTFVGGFTDLAAAVGASRARVVQDMPAAARGAVVRADAVRDVLEHSGAASIREARVQGIAADASAPEILIAAEELPHPPVAWSGVAAVITAESADATGWVLRVRPDGTARLDPPGIEVSPQTLTPHDYEQLVSLLATADTRPELELDDAHAGEDRTAALEALPQPTEGSELASAPDTHPPRVLVLGPVHVEDADDSSAPGRRRRATELVAYLALHPGASSHQIDEAMWPGHRVPKNTRNPFVSRVRQWLGRTPDGAPYLPLVADGGEYHLRPEVTCDWHDFLHLARRGLPQGPDGAHDLAAAFDLVRGRPFLGIDPATYTWAEVDIQEMISSIVDVAHVLSAIRSELGDHRGAHEAAAKGLLVDPCSELLYQDAIRAAAARGDHQEVDRLADRLRHELALVDPDDGIAETTVELISGATRRP